MGKNRTRYDIYAKMLSACEKGTTKTDLIYDARANYSVVQSFLDVLISHSLVEAKDVDERGTYLTTKKGKDFLWHYQNLTKLLSK